MICFNSSETASSIEPVRAVMPPPTVLIVEPNEADGATLRESIECDGLRVVVATFARDAISRMHKLPADLAVINVQIPDASGFLLAPLLRAIRSDIRLVFTSNVHEATIESRARRSGAIFYAPKPVHPPLIRQVILSALAISEPSAH